MEFHWKFYGRTKFSAISLVLLLPLTMLSGVKSDCNYYQNMKPGEKYYIYNPEYPNPYRGENRCEWKLESPYTIKFNCNLNMTKNCFENNFSIQFDDGNQYRYCDNETFVVHGTNATVKLYSSNNAMGTVLCEVISDKPFDDFSCQCGWKNPTRIVGGKETGVNEFPMMAGLVDSKLRLLYCGATIISNQYVITAAHCVERRDINKLGVVVGEHDVTTSNETNATRLYRINKCVMHPNYENNQNDIAICKINGTINFSSKVGPVCLPFQHHRDSFGGAIVTVVGWGLMQFAGAKATKLQQVDLNIINEAQCKNSDPELNYVNNKYICTYTPGKDSCQMDSGGPVLWENPTTHNQIIVGITVSGVGCASNVPSISTRVGSYIKWIISETPGVQYCKAE